MKLPTLSSGIKHTTATRFALFCAATATCGCASTSAQAPFPVRADTVVPGDLLGPFEGHVVDGQTGKPIDNAAVLGGWAWGSGGGMEGPASARSTLTQTDADGRYVIGRLSELTDGRLERFTLIVYKQGYLPYRSDRRFEDYSVRHDFAQTGNVAKLDRTGPDTSHTRLVRFIGAGGPLLPRLASELQQAHLEQQAPTVAEGGSEGGKATGAGGKLDAGKLLTPEDVKAVTGYKGAFTVEKLRDLPSTANYDSLHFAAESEPERFDVGLRLFRLDPAAAEKQFETMLGELPGAVEKNEVGDRSLRAREGDILAVGALDRAHGIVLLFTCGEGQCKDHETVAVLVKRMLARIDRLGPATAPSTTMEFKPSPPPPEEKPPASGPEEFKLKPPEFKP